MDIPQSSEPGLHALLHGADKAIEHGVTEAEEIFELLRETLPQHFDREKSPMW